MAVFSGNGADGSPSFTFSSDTDTGIYREDADALGVTAGGSALTIFRSTRVDVRNSETFPADIPTTNTLFRAVRTNSSANSNSRAYADQRPAVVAGISATLNTNNEGVHSALQTTSFIGVVTTPPAHIRSYSFSGVSGATRNLKYEVDGSGNVNLFDGAGIRFNSAQSIDGTLLDDYEEGTWTATLDSTDQPDITATGLYRKVGAIVYFTVSFTLGFSKTITPNRFDLPFTATSLRVFSGCVMVSDDLDPRQTISAGTGTGTFGGTFGVYLHTNDGTTLTLVLPGTYTTRLNVTGCFDTTA